MTRFDYELLEIQARREYLETVASEYNLNPEQVFFLAELYHAEENFDGLLCALNECEQLKQED